MLGTGDMVLYVSNRISGFICWNNISGFICWEQDIWFYMLGTIYQASYAGTIYQASYAGNRISMALKLLTVLNRRGTKRQLCIFKDCSF